MLPRLFFLHFEGTSFVAEDVDGDLAGFVCGFLSQTDPDEAYIHFVGVSPEHRGGGRRATPLRALLRRRRWARADRWCAASRHRRTRTRSPSMRHSGFEVDRVVEDYDGPGEDRVLLLKRLT